MIVHARIGRMVRGQEVVDERDDRVHHQVDEKVEDSPECTDNNCSDKEMKEWHQ